MYEAGKNKWGVYKWHCRCVCGNESDILGSCLRNGSSKSCGCLRSEVSSKLAKTALMNLKHTRKDISGRRFGNLTVIEDTERSNKHGKAIWRCKCDCGNEVEVTAYLLLKGETKSCGCLKFSKLGLHGAIVDVMNGYIKRARKNKLEFTLQPKEFEELIHKDCFYCGTPPSNHYKSRFDDNDCIYNGLDRVDNTKGYTVDNVVPCCKNCNTTKGALSTDEFRAWVNRVYSKIIQLQSPAKDVCYG